MRVLTLSMYTINVISNLFHLKILFLFLFIIYSVYESQCPATGTFFIVETSFFNVCDECSFILYVINSCAKILTFVYTDSHIRVKESIDI